jgi:hypothetical protein
VGKFQMCRMHSGYPKKRASESISSTHFLGDHMDSDSGNPASKRMAIHTHHEDDDDDDDDGSMMGSGMMTGRAAGEGMMMGGGGGRMGPGNPTAATGGPL